MTLARQDCFKELYQMKDDKRKKVCYTENYIIIDVTKGRKCQYKLQRSFIYGFSSYTKTHQCLMYSSNHSKRQTRKRKEYISHLVLLKTLDPRFNVSKMKRQEARSYQAKLERYMCTAVVVKKTLRHLCS